MLQEMSFGNLSAAALPTDDDDFSFSGNVCCHSGNFSCGNFSTHSKERREK
jgi:hypothetical protein